MRHRIVCPDVASLNPFTIGRAIHELGLTRKKSLIAGVACVTQVVTGDWAKSTLHGERRTRWYDEVASRIRPDRPTLVVCTQACEPDLRMALHERGHTNVIVAHYGAVRGSNAYKGYDVILAQVYHPNIDAVIREGRALFAGDDVPLDERMVTTERVLQDGTGERWVVQVPTFADPRLAALLAHRREAELVQAALRGRPLDHPEAQITLLFGLPLESLLPTEVQEGAVSAQSNAGRQEQARMRIAGAIKQLLADGKRVISVEDLAGVTGMSEVTIRRHLPYLAGRLRLRLIEQRRLVFLPKGGQRVYRRMVLLQRGRGVRAAEQTEVRETNDSIRSQTRDQAHNTDSRTCLIHRHGEDVIVLPVRAVPHGHWNRASTQTLVFDPCKKPV